MKRKKRNEKNRKDHQEKKTDIPFDPGTEKSP
jgi:hypothetical protein